MGVDVDSVLVECPTCYGTGGWSDEWHDKDGEYHYEFDECVACGGTGKVDPATIAPPKSDPLASSRWQVYPAGRDADGRWRAWVRRDDQVGGYVVLGQNKEDALEAGRTLAEQKNAWSGGVSLDDTPESEEKRTRWESIDDAQWPDVSGWRG